MPPDVDEDGLAEGLEPHDGSTADYLLRSAQQEAVAVSALADQRADILLGVPLIVVTAVVGILPTTGVTIALVVLGVSTAVAAALALLCLLPSTAVAERTPNPLFFADIGRMSFDDYRARMIEVLRSSPSIHEAILVDRHASSTILLHRKCRCLRLADLEFTVGLTLTVAAVPVDLAGGNI